MADIVENALALLSNSGGQSGDQVQDDAAPELSPYDLNNKEALEEANERMNALLSVDRFSRVRFERDWFRNILYIVGQHSIMLEKGIWRPRNLPVWYPRTKTNKVGEKFNDLVTAYMEAQLPINWNPATDSAEDRAMSEMGEYLRKIIYAESKLEDRKSLIAGWLAATGNVFLIPYYDMDDSYGTIGVQYQNCPTCGENSLPNEIEDANGACPICSEQGNDAPQNFIPAEDESGQPVEAQLPIGAFQAEICSPFEIRLDHRIAEIDKHKRFVKIARPYLDEAKEKWEDVDGVDVNKFSAETGKDLINYYLDQLANVTSDFSAAGGSLGAPSGDTAKRSRVTQYEMYDLPSDMFPQGLCMTRIGSGVENIVEMKPLKTQYGAGVRKGQYFLPLIHGGGDIIPGRLYRKSRIDDLIPLQTFRNTISAHIRLTVQRMGNGIWLNPKGSGMTGMTGEPGQVHDYNPVSVGGTTFAKPERIPPDLAGVQNLVMLLNKLDDEIERMTGTFFLQGGEAPPGVTAASALAYLGEKAQRSMSMLMGEWAKMFRRFEIMGLEILRANATDPRFISLGGENRQWELKKFIIADMQGAVNLDIDYNGIAPKSLATERASIQQLIAMQVLNPAAPETQRKILESFGQTRMQGSQDLDIREATIEADEFLNANKLPQLIPLVQNSAVHLLEHTNFAKKDAFKALPAAKKNLWFVHIQATVADLVTRIMTFRQLGIDPNTPGMEEMSSGEAMAALQSMMAGMPGQAQPGQSPGQAGADMGAGGPQPGNAPKKPMGNSQEQLPDIAADAVTANAMSHMPKSVRTPDGPQTLQ